MIGSNVKWSPGKAFVLAAGASLVSIGIAAYVCERPGRPLFYNIYSGTDHWFWSSPGWVMQAPVKDRDGVLGFADFNRNVIVIVRDFVPDHYVTLVSSTAEVARFRLNEAAGIYMNVWSRQNEILVIYDFDMYAAMELTEGQAHRMYDLMHAQPEKTVLEVVDSSGLDNKVRAFVRQFRGRLVPQR